MDLSRERPKKEVMKGIVADAVGEEKSPATHLY